MTALAHVPSLAETQSLDLSAIDRGCTRVARALERRNADEITLLRAARTLKRVYVQLDLAAQRSLMVNGYTQRSVQAVSLVRSIEGRLRRILLDRASLSQMELVENLNAAVAETFDVLEILES